MSLRKNGKINMKMAMNKKTAEIGRDRNISKLPLEMIKDCRKAPSKIGPKTKASTMGAGSYSYFFIKYPIIPKKTII
jgi:hypothetical protein